MTSVAALERSARTRSSKAPMNRRTPKRRRSVAAHAPNSLPGNSAAGGADQGFEDSGGRLDGGPVGRGWSRGEAGLLAEVVEAQDAVDHGRGQGMVLELLCDALAREGAGRQLV